MFLSWWNQTERKEKFIQILTFFLFFGASLDLKGVLFGTPMTLAGLYIIYDCIKRKSLAGFYLPVRYWLGLAVFMGTVVLASLILGDGPSILAAFQNVYRCLPFIVVIYLGKQADIKYAALLGAMASVLVSSASMLYLTQYLGIKKRVGAFSNHPNYYASLLAGVLPVLLAAFQDARIRALKKIYFLQGIVALLGLWSLSKTGSRGAMLGLFGGGILMYGVICFYRKRFKQFLNGFTVCVAVAAVLVLAVNREVSVETEKARLRMLRSSYAMWQDHKLAGVGLANWQKEYNTTYLLKEEIEAKALQRYQKWEKAAKRRAAAARKAAAAKKAAAQKAEAAKKAAVAKKAAEQKNATPQKATAVKAASPKPKPRPTAEQKAAQKAAAAKKAAAEREAKQIAARKQAAIKHEAEISMMPHNVAAWFFSTTGSLGGAGYVFFVCWYIWLFCKELKRSDVAWVDAVGFWVFLAITIHGMVDAGIIYKAPARLLYLVMALSISYYCFADRQ